MFLAKEIKMSEQRAFPCCDCEKEFYLVSLSDEDAESYDEAVSMDRYDDYLGCMVPNVSSFERGLASMRNMKTIIMPALIAVQIVKI